MPWTLYRYILRDLLRLLVLSTAVLVLVIAFAAAIKPLADGLLGPAGLLRFVLYSVPTMLAFALPFAAAFSGTLVFSRMAADNEVLACRASGMSYFVILLPVVFLGVVLTLGLFYLSNWVAPQFFRLAERQIQKDMTTLLVAQINKRQPFPLGNRIMLYADRADDSQLPPPVPGSEVQPTRLIILQGVALAILDEERRPRREFTAHQADIWLYSYHGQTYAGIQIADGSYFDAGTGELQPRSFSGHGATIPPVRLPSPFSDELQFLSWPELRRLGAEPERFDKVAARKRRLAEAIAAERTLARLEAALESGGEAGVRLIGPAETEYVLSAPRVARRGTALELSAAGGVPVSVAVRSGGLISHRMTAQSAEVKVEPDETDTEPLIQIDLDQVTISDSRSPGGPTQQRERPLPRTRLAETVAGPLNDLRAAELLALSDRMIAEAAAAEGQVRPLQRARRGLQREMIGLGRKILARLHERAASAVGCLLLLLLGALLSLRLRGSMPLVIYFWTFLLATLALVIARSGENIASTASRDDLSIGLAVIWSGNALVLAACAALYFRVSRN